MKRSLTALGALLLLVSLTAMSCPSSSSSTSLKITGRFSLPIFFVYEGGELSYEDFYAPISGGTPVSDASVVVKNLTTETEQTLTYRPPDECVPIGSYCAGAEFVHAAGENVAVEITVGEEVYTGSSTPTPDGYAVITAPATSATVGQPFDLTWTVVQGSTAATHAIVMVKNFSTMPYIQTWQVVPIGTTTVSISGYPEAEYPYYLTVFLVNRMEITGGGDTFYAYVGSTSMEPNSVMVTITP